MGLSDEAWILTSNSLEYLDTTFGIVETTTFLDTWSLITADKIKRCHTCHVIKELHPNVLQLHASDCKSQVPPQMLCSLARNQKTQYLFRKNLLANPQCPKVFTQWGISYNITYEESTLESGTYQRIQNCGQPRSELNSCFRKQVTEPQFSLTLGPCPESTLVHRLSLTQNLQCIGTFSKSGLKFLVAKGSEYEYWDESTYKANEDVYRCFAYKVTDLGLQLTQGLGSDCNGMSGDLTLSNGLRTMNLMKIQRNGMNCQFPNWVLKQWKIIPRGGMRAMPQNSAPRPRQVTFPDLHSFILASQLGSPRGQKFKCASVVNASRNEIVVTAFTQSQCYGEYQCLHAKLTSDQFVEIHVGAPTPNIEHACLKPSFDLDVPYLLATLVPSDIDIAVIPPNENNIINPMEFSANSPTHNNNNNPRISDTNSNQEANLMKIGQHAMTLLNQYQSEFNEKVRKWMEELMTQIKLLCV